MRVIVVGGGILGLAVARLFALDGRGHAVTLLEKEDAVGQHQTGHNSGVIHAGLYYPPGSLKARLCHRGAQLLKDFCVARGVAYEQCGKLVVATRDSELRSLDQLQERASANGVPGLRRVDGRALRAIEPHVTGIAALHSPTTAIVDFAEVARALAPEIVARGGTIRTRANVAQVDSHGGSARVLLTDGVELQGDHVIVCAGLHADRLARASGLPAEPRIIPFRGEYWQLRPERRDLVRGLIYPVPDPALPFLGIHLTRKVDGSVWIGPNAVLAISREGYRRRDFKLDDLRETLAWPGTAKLMRQHWRVGVREILRSTFRAAFVREARRYVPELQGRDTIRAPAGVRAQAVDRDGTLVDDFRVAIAKRTIWIRNAPSPAATSALAIAEEIAARIEDPGSRSFDPQRSG